MIGGTNAATNVVGMVLLGYGVLTANDTSGHGGVVVAVSLLGVAIAAWLVWLAGRVRPRGVRAAPAALAVMAVAGGALTGVAPLGMVLPAVAAMGMTLASPLRRALVVVLGGPVAMAVSVPLAGRSWGVMLGGLSAVLAGTIIGVNRRDMQERAAQVASVELARARAEAAAARAELLAGRNHLARELHDVLAHTLSALSVQLEALDALMGPSALEAKAHLGGIKRLVRDGLDEAKGAVAALREDLPALEERVAKLASERRAEVDIDGHPRRLEPGVALALYRVAQEALTNVSKHAPGASTRVRLSYSDTEVTVAVANAARPGVAAADSAAPSDGAAAGSSGGGYGLQGIRERVLLLGGIVEAGPDDDGGWRVEARVPA